MRDIRASTPSNLLPVLVISDRASGKVIYYDCLWSCIYDQWCTSRRDNGHMTVKKENIELL